MPYIITYSLPFSFVVYCICYAMISLGWSLITWSKSLSDIFWIVIDECEDAESE